MAMDFFEHQEKARRNTGRLVILFVLAVLGIIVAVHLAVTMLLMFTGSRMELPAGDPLAIAMNPFVIIGSIGGVLLIVSLGSVYKIAMLNGGGHVVAEMMGGKQLQPFSQDADERKLLNVVEEMALASGVPVPPVYVMEGEQGINAFAAGYSPEDAVIGVTRGSIEMLSRDELQGVIAHEFSHILNGDMRLNIRLIGIIHGILVLGLLGYVLLRGGAYSSMGSRRGKDGGAGAIVLFGLALWIIGYIGMFFGNLIKSAVSRQREFLADAAAVQFTRYPQGIAGALKKIGGFTDGSHIENPKSQEISHMYFGQSFESALNFMFATHPPLIERIRRIDPSFDGKFESRTRKQIRAQVVQEQSMGFAGEGATKQSAPAAPTPPVPPAPPAVQGKRGSGESAVDAIGQPTLDHINYAGALIRSLPPVILQAAHEPYAARAIVLGLLLDPDETIRQKQLERIRNRVHAQTHGELLRLANAAAQVDPAARMPLIDLAAPAMGQMSSGQYEQFIAAMDDAIQADDKVSLFEWVLRRVVAKHLGGHFRPARPPKVKWHSLKPLAEQCAILLSTLAYVGHTDVDDAQQAFAAGAKHMELPGLTLQPIESCSLRAMDQVLDDLNQTTPRDKRKLIIACANCIAADRQVTVREGELMRAIADSLGAPMPPILPGQRLS